MKKLYLAVFSAVFFIACGDEVTEVTQVNQASMEVVSSVSKLPKCTSDNEGEMALVKGESMVRVCVDGEWFATASGEAGDFSCKTEELKDGSGLKILCNGDSIGVVLNGEKGDAGKDGRDGEDGTDGKDAVVANDTLENDSERVSISLDSLAGYSQKGPFLKGSTVYLYELSDGHTLKQTNGNFTSFITRDDGRYKFTARDLVSQYAMIVVEGVYRNEVTGKPSKATLRLRAISDMRKHSDANINLLTHLEYDRVYYLVTRGDSTNKKLTVKQAKRQAQRELLKQFHIELDGNADAEDLNVFGRSDADAALLAISVLLQGDGSETDLSVLLTEISNDMEQDGKWDDSVTKAKIADWAMNADLSGRLDLIRENVTSWGLGTAPDFKNIVRRFYSKELRLGVCDGKDVSNGTVRHVSNTGSVYHAALYTDTSGTNESRPERKTRFVCDDEGAFKWRVASDLEKDRFDWQQENTRDGKIFAGQITGNAATWNADTIRYASKAEIYLNRACVNYIENTEFVPDNQMSSYRCTADGWVFDVKANARTMQDSRDGNEYVTMVVENAEWMAENLNYEIADSYCYNDSVENCNEYGRLYTWDASMIACPEGWHLPSSREWDALNALAVRLLEPFDSLASNPLKSTSGWGDYCVKNNYGKCIEIRSGNGSDMLGLSILPAGEYYGSGDSRGKGEESDFWLSGNFGDNDWASFITFYTESRVDQYGTGSGNKSSGKSVRCVKDE